MLPNSTGSGSISSPELFSVPPELREDFRQWEQASRHSLENAGQPSLHTETELLKRIRIHPCFARASNAFRAFIFNESGGVLNRCYVQSGNMEDLEAAMDCWEEALKLTPAGPLALCCRNNLAAGLRAHYFRNGDPEELHRAIKLLEEAIEQTPEDSPDLPARLNNIGNALHTRWEREGDPGDLQAGIAVLERAVFLTHIQSSDLPVRLNNLARLLLQLYNTSGHIDDLDKAIEASEQAVRLIPVHSFDRPLCLAGLGIGLSYRYAHKNDPVDLQKSITFYQDALRRIPDGAPEKPIYLNDLGIALKNRYQRSGNLEDLQQALEAYERAIDLTPGRSPELPRYLNNQGVGLGMLYDRTGRLDVLERVIAVSRKAVEHTHSASPELSARLSVLATGLMDRYARTVDQRDLKQATEVYEEALRNTMAGAPLRPFILSDLAGSLRRLARVTGNREYLDRAIDILKAALRETSTEAASRPFYLANLGSTLAQRYDLSGDVVTLQQAIALSEEAVALAAPDSPNGPRFFFNLAENLYRRYLLTKDVEQLRQVIRVCEEALAAASPDSPFFPSFLGAVGRALVEQYALTKCQEDLGRAINIYDQALAVMKQSFTLAPADYQLGQPQSDLLEVHIGAALAFLTAASASSGDAGTWLLKALAAVEATKSRLLTIMVARRRIPAPPSIPADLVEREWTLGEELASLDAQALARLGLPARQEMEGLRDLNPDPDATVRRPHPSLRGLVDRQERIHRWSTVHQALQEAQADIDRCAEGPAYLALRRGDYLSPQEICNLAAGLGEATALLSLAVDLERTLLFAVCAGWPEPRVCEIPLGANEWEGLMFRFFREVHLFDGSSQPEETWPGVLHPLLAQVTPHLQGVGHVVVVPHRAGHVLPWGVLASREGWPASVSTAPALGWLAQVLRHPDDSSSRPEALVIGDPTKDLSHAGSEARQVAKLFNTTPLIGPLARKDTVLQQLERQDVQLAHFSTHAYFAADSPFNSGIRLADGILTAREILERGLRMPRFVVLSACETGITRPLGGDELAGLSQALFVAGARSQLVSLWKVDDPATEHLITGFYRHWVAGEDKATALRKAMDGTRLTSTNWAHTYYWGAFTLVGDWR